MKWGDILWGLGQLVQTAGIIFLLLLQLCGKKESISNTIHTETRIVYDSTKKSPPAVAPPVAMYERSVEVPGRVDTAAILRAFYTERSYKQEYADTNLRATVSNTLFANKLINQCFDYRWLKPIETVKSSTITETKSAKGFYLGGFVSGKNFGIGPQASYLTKREVLISAGADLVNKSFFVGTQFKIAWKK